jgi:hypothetical protein
MRRTLPARFIIPDSGPLISLALATIGDAKLRADGKSYLDLLKQFGRPIQLIDQIRYECTHNNEKPDAALIADWLHRNANIVEDIETETGRNFRMALDRGEQPKTRHKGELAIDEFLLEFDDYRYSEDETVVVLFEEEKISRLLDDRKNVKLLTTSAFIRTLEMNNVLSYDRFMSSIQSQDSIRGVLKGYPLVDTETKATDVEVDWQDAFKLS